MSVIKSAFALAIVAGFATVSFAQGSSAAVPAVTPAAKVVAPAPATAEKKIETPKAVEPAKVEAAKVQVAASEAKPASANKEHHKAKHKAQAKVETAPAAPSAPASK